uniref:Neur_chan_memb domain-containing protein n=1 Tax=Panagrellus redivivus TaxID=6233 RepID=A0A7E4V1V6_PANRE
MGQHFSRKRNSRSGGQPASKNDVAEETAAAATAVAAPPQPTVNVTVTTPPEVSQIPLQSESHAVTQVSSVSFSYLVTILPVIFTQGKSLLHTSEVLEWDSATSGDPTIRLVIWDAVLFCTTIINTLEGMKRGKRKRKRAALTP